MLITRNGVYYRRQLPHYRSPGGIYHCRFSLNPENRNFRIRNEWMFAVIEDAILSEHKKECLVYAYIIMEDHSHSVIQPLPQANDPFVWCDSRKFYPLERITGRIKGRSARVINQRSGRAGSLWQHESFDRTIRNERDLEETIDYLHHNPVRPELVQCPEQYRWSSLRTIYSGRDEYRGWFDLPVGPGARAQLPGLKPGPT
jgi:putative transposase